MTTKILALTDALGNLVNFRLMPGQAHDLRGTKTLIRGLCAGHLLADRAFDADWLHSDLIERDIIPVIPQNRAGRSQRSSARNPENGGI